jgi:hypothetical protein
MRLICTVDGPKMTFTSSGARKARGVTTAPSDGCPLPLARMDRYHLRQEICKRPLASLFH